MAPKVKTAKNSNLPKLRENYFELVGKGGWPLISIWIIVGARGHVASDWNFIYSQIVEVKGPSCGNSRYVRSQNNPSHQSQRTRGERLEFH
jgi:hypothetical protein